MKTPSASTTPYKRAKPARAVPVPAWAATPAPAVRRHKPRATPSSSVSASVAATSAPRHRPKKHKNPFLASTSRLPGLDRPAPPPEDKKEDTDWPLLVAMFVFLATAAGAGFYLYRSSSKPKTNPAVPPAAPAPPGMFDAVTEKMPQSQNIAIGAALLLATGVFLYLAFKHYRANKAAAMRAAALLLPPSGPVVVDAEKRKEIVNDDAYSKSVDALADMQTADPNYKTNPEYIKQVLLHAQLVHRLLVQNSGTPNSKVYQALSLDPASSASQELLEKITEIERYTEEAREDDPPEITKRKRLWCAGVRTALATKDSAAENFLVKLNACKQVVLNATIQYKNYDYKTELAKLEELLLHPKSAHNLEKLELDLEAHVPKKEETLVAPNTPVAPNYPPTELNPIQEKKPWSLLSWWPWGGEDEDTSSRVVVDARLFKDLEAKV